MFKTLLERYKYDSHIILVAHGTSPQNDAKRPPNLGAGPDSSNSLPITQVSYIGSTVQYGTVLRRKISYGALPVGRDNMYLYSPLKIPEQRTSNQFRKKT